MPHVLVTGDIGLVLVATAAIRTAIAVLRPLGRFGTPADQVAAMDWLPSPETTRITSQVLGVDGGLGGLRGQS